MRADARALLNVALPGARRLTSPRAIASAILGCDAALAGDMADDTAAHLRLPGRSACGASFAALDLGSDWPWPEETLTYENALLPHALIVAGRRLADANLRSIGLTLLDWLIEVQTTRRGQFTPIGNDGWWTRGGQPAPFDQQPIEATAHDPRLRPRPMKSPRIPATSARLRGRTGGSWATTSRASRLADVVTGGCRDGLSEDQVNANQGAESTLMWLTALEPIRLLRTNTMASRQARSRGGVTVLTEVHA